MLKKLAFVLLCASTTLANHTYAMETHSLQSGVTIVYDLPPNEPQQFINYMFWTVEAECKLTSPDESNEFFAKALAKKGKINGITLSSGHNISLTVRSGDVMKLSAESGAKVEITNLGPSTVKATCTA